MRNRILITLTLLLLYPAASFCQIDECPEGDTIHENEYKVIDDWLSEDTIPKNESTHNDSLGGMRYRPIDEKPYGCQNPKSVIEETDTISLCVYFYDLKEKVYNEVTVQLETDGMQIPYKFYSVDEAYPSVAVNLTLIKFKEIFKGIYDYSCRMASSYNGFYWQEYIDTYTLPEKYKTKIERVSVIDPQLGGCY